MNTEQPWYKAALNVLRKALNEQLELTSLKELEGLVPSYGVYGNLFNRTFERDGYEIRKFLPESIRYGDAQMLANYMIREKAEDPDKFMDLQGVALGEWESLMGPLFLTREGKEEYIKNK